MGEEQMMDEKNEKVYEAESEYYLKQYEYLFLGRIIQMKWKLVMRWQNG